MSTRVRLTRVGVFLFLAALSLVVSGALTGRQDVLAAGIFMTGALTASIAYSMLASASHSSTVVVREAYMGREASKGTIVLRIHNRSSMPMFWLMVEDSVPPGVVTYRRPAFFVPALVGGSMVEVSYRATARMGKHCFEKPRLRVRDPLGFAESEIGFEYEGTRCFNVKPLQAQREEIVRLIWGRIIGEGAVRDKGFGIELYQLREYREGDPAKLIDWKATARIGKIIVKETLTEQKGEAEIVLLADSRGSQGAPFSTPIERAARLVSGLAATLKSMGYSVRLYLVTPQFEASVAGLEDAEARVSDALSRIELPIKGVLGEASIRKALDSLRRGEAVVITAGPDPGLIARLAGKRAEARLHIVDVSGRGEGNG